MPAALYRLQREFPGMESDERVEIYDEVWTSLLERQRTGFWPDDLDAWLDWAVVRRARHEHRKRSGRRTDPSDPFCGEMTLVPDAEMEETVLGALDAESYEAIIASLSATGRLVAKLRFDWGLSAGEISELTGLDRRRCYKEIERATAQLRKGGRRVRRGEHVRGYEKLLRRFFAGTATEAERAEATSLIEHSSHARMIAVQMFRDAREVGALLPAPALGDQHAHGTALELLSATKQHLLDGLTGAKQQATAAYVRASEVPQQLGQHASALRPGAAAMAITGCLAVGSGTAACLIEGVNPVRPLYDTLDTGSAEPKEKADRPAEDAKPTAPSPTATPSPLPSQPDSATPQPTPTQSAQPASPSPSPTAPSPSQAAPSPAAPQRDFEFEQSRPTTPPAPAAAPQQGSGEFF